MIFCLDVNDWEIIGLVLKVLFGDFFDLKLKELFKIMGEFLKYGYCEFLLFVWM